ncbi:MAG: SRPBCC family protein [Rhodanobacteraceae bacterium]|nr:SRPBCC family protein [Rhodanobacteraceae bacterium]
MRLLLRLLMLLLVLITLLVALAFALPDHARVERSITVARPASQIYLLLNHVRRFKDWSPWHQRDPATIYTYSGPDSGVGAKLTWKSAHRDVGEGSQMLVAATPDQTVSFELDFGPRGMATARFDIAALNGETRVTWSFDTKLPLHFDESFGWGVAGRYLGLFMDRLVGADFERGLSNLKQLAEQFPNVDIAGLSAQLVDLPERRLIYVAVEEDVDDAATLRRWNAAVAQLTRFAAQNGLTISGAPLSLVTRQDALAGRFELALVTHYDVMPEDTLVRGRELAPARAAQLLHRGDASGRRKSIEKLRAWMAIQGLHGKDQLIEEYVEGDLLQGAARISMPLQAEAVQAH